MNYLGWTVSYMAPGEQDDCLETGTLVDFYLQEDEWDVYLWAIVLDSTGRVHSVCVSNEDTFFKVVQATPPPQEGAHLGAPPMTPAIPQ